MEIINRNYNSATTLHKKLGSKHKGIEAIIVDMPSIVVEMGIAKAMQDGHPDPLNYWRENEYKRAREWTIKNAHGFNGTSNI